MPLCVRIDADDEKRRAELLADGWREIEIFEVYETENARVAAELENQFRGFIRECAALARSGRLWRDPQVPAELAEHSYAEWAYALSAPSPSRLVAHYDAKWAGFIVTTPDIDSVPRIAFFAVLPQYRGKGVGKMLIEKMLELQGDALRAGTASTNSAAIHLYKSHGMKLVSRQRTFHK